MFKALLDRVLELSKIRTTTVGDITYTKENIFRRIKAPEQVPPETLKFNNLIALVDYLDRVSVVIDPTYVEYRLKGFDIEKLFFAIMSPTEVSLMSSPDPANENIQFKFATATLSENNFRFGDYCDLEIFIIGLLSRFEPTTDRDNIIEMLAHLANEHVVQNTDDKFSQSLQVKTALTTKAQVDVKNPVTLKPFRTFREVDQPESEFILRYRSSGKIVEAALFEGDGGRWRLDAIKNIKEWLTLNTLDTKIPVIG